VSFHSSNDDDGGLEAEDVLVGVLVHHFPLDRRSHRRICLLHMQREGVGVGLARLKRASKPASFAGIDIGRRPRNRNVEDHSVNRGFGSFDCGGRWQNCESDGSGDIGSPDNSASHVRGVSASLEDHAFDFAQSRTAVLPNELRSSGGVERVLDGIGQHKDVGGRLVMGEVGK